MEVLRTALSRLVRAVPSADAQARVRLWVDRAFTITGAGTVVTGTLGSGTLRAGDELELAGRRVVVRGLHTLEQSRDSVSAYARVAVNLRGVPASQAGRGQALITPGAWHRSDVVDARLVFPQNTPLAADRGLRSREPDLDAHRLPEHLMLHLGTSAGQARIRPLSLTTARLHLDRPLPLAAGDRAILRDPGTGRVVGVVLLDVDPPALRRRGAGRRRGTQLAEQTGRSDLASEVARRGHLTVEQARRLGLVVPAEPPSDVIRAQEWFIASAAWRDWVTQLIAVVTDYEHDHPLDPLMPAPAAAAALTLPDRRLLTALAATAGLQHERGRVHRPGATASLGAAEQGLAEIEARLALSPFAAPEQPDLAAAALGPREIAAAVKAGRLLALGDGVLLQPIAPAKAMRVLAGLPQPFTTSEARAALGTTRRVAIPLLEYLDSRGWTQRLDAGHREIVR